MAKLLSEGQSRRVGRVVQANEGARMAGDQRARPRLSAGSPVRLAVLKEALASGGAADGVLLIWDAQAEELVEETDDEALYITIHDRLDDGTLPGISGEDGRRCYVVPDVTGLPNHWMIIQTLFTCGS